MGMQLLKEVSVGYLFGFLFSLLMEGAAFAGQIFGVMSGFSATELISSAEASEHPFMARLFSLLVFTLFLGLDFHHVLIRMLFESIKAVPLITVSPFSFEIVSSIIEATTRLFHHALNYAIFPLLTLSLLLAVIAVTSRFLPHLFWISFPLQSITGITSLALALYFFTPTLERAFYEFVSIAGKVLFPL